MSQNGGSAGPGFDLSRVSRADRIILGGAIAYLIWVFLPFWYRCCSILGISVDVGSVNGFRTTIVLAWILALAAVIEIVLAKIMGTELRVPAKRGLIHLIVAGTALVLTLLGIVAKPNGSMLGWGIFVGLAVNLVWLYGAYMLFSEPE